MIPTMYAALALLAATPTLAFVPSAQRAATSTPMSMAEIDYDAPVLANPMSASGPLDHEIVVDDDCYLGKDAQLNECADWDPPQTMQNLRQMLENIDYDAPVMYYPSQASGPLDHEIVVDDDCYLGKDAQLNQCADWDPPASPSKSLTQLMAEIDYDAPVMYYPSQASGPLAHEIVVDDECYLGKDGQLTECADWDPPVSPQNLKQLMAEVDFDAPVTYNPVLVGTPLDHEIVVEDECYLGKDAQLTECADFDP